jgi:hypothetical protein
VSGSTGPFVQKSIMVKQPFGEGIWIVWIACDDRRGVFRNGGTGRNKPAGRDDRTRKSSQPESPHAHSHAVPTLISSAPDMARPLSGGSIERCDSAFWGPSVNPQRAGVETR